MWLPLLTVIFDTTAPRITLQLIQFLCNMEMLSLKLGSKLLLKEGRELNELHPKMFVVD
jgi:hypothetical protein